jgi:hypothetical protein
VLLALVGCGPQEEGDAQAPEVASLKQAIKYAVDDFEIVVPGSARCMDVANFSTAPGGPIHQWACHGDTNQVWRFTPVGGQGEAVYRITSRHSGLALEIPGFSTASGAALQQFTPNGGANQQFRVLPAANGLVRLQAVHSNLCLSVNRTVCFGRGCDAADFTDGAPFRQYACSTTDWRQHFRIDRLGALSRKALVVLMENEGYRDGLPFDQQVNLTVPTGLRFACGGWQIDLGLNANVNDAINALRGRFGFPLQCLNPGNWSVNTLTTTQAFNPADAVRRFTDFAPEAVGAALVHGLADGKYDTVRILEDNAFNVARVRQELLMLSPNHVIDVHVLAHGDEDSFGPGGVFTASSVRDLRSVVGLSLRAVFQQNCTAQPLNDDWRLAGARVVTGTAGINSMPTAYAPFLRRWTAGESFQTAVTSSVNEVTPMYRRSYSFIDQYDEGTDTIRTQFDVFGQLSSQDEVDGSTQVIDGDGAIRL